MKANEYIKKYGLVCANIKIAEIEHSKDFDGFYFELKRLVESHELVERVISDHNKSFKECQIDIHGLKSFVKKNPKIYPKRLKQAIADVESCQ